jgi:F0F1-type ATP synthase membrane subunit b/b'
MITINESFYVAISFILLMLVIYKPITNYLSTYLQNNIDQLYDQISDAQNLNNQMRNLFSDTQNKFDEFIKTKEQTINLAQQNALKAQKDYADYTQTLVRQRKKDFAVYLKNLQLANFKNANLKIMQYSINIVEQVIAHEDIYISNKLN